MPWKNRVNTAASQAVTSAKQVTAAASVKNKPNMEPARLARNATPAPAAASSKPSTNRAV